MTTAEIIAALKDISLAGAAIITSCAALTGLSKWRRELRGKTEFDIAFNLAKATYKLREEMRSCRSPIVSSSEFPPGTSLSSQSDSAEGWVHVFQTRWKPVAEALRDFDANSLAAEALWGQNMRVKTDQFRKCAGTLNGAMQAFVDNQAVRGEDFKANKDFGIEMRRTVFSSGSKDNKLDQQIARAIQDIESQIRPHLSRS